MNAVYRYAVEDNATALIEYESGVRGVVACGGIRR